MRNIGERDGRSQAEGTELSKDGGIIVERFLEKVKKNIELQYFISSLVLTHVRVQLLMQV